MKKLSIIAVLALLPVASFAKGIFDFDTPRFFVEYGVELYSNSSSEYKMDGKKIAESDLSTLNGYGVLYVGADFDGVQIGFSPEYVDDDNKNIFALNMRAVVPFMTGNVQPYASVQFGIASLEYSDDVVSYEDTAFAYGIGAGVKYSFNDNVYIKGGIEYNIMKFDTDIYDSNYEISTSDFLVVTSLGYRF